MAAVILVTNDDGVHAAGLGAPAAALDELGEVYVVAPDREQSAVGHALTLHRPLRVTQLGERRFAVNGTPSDCVNLAVLGLLPGRPVLVAAGINHGSNLGDDVTYSGTVAAGMEGTPVGVPSIAVSQAGARTAGGGGGGPPHRAPEEAAAVIGRRREPGAAAEGEQRYARERDRMVAEQLVKRGIADPLVLEAMRGTPRHPLVDAGRRGEAAG